MLSEKIISLDVPTIKIEDEGVTALNLMDVFRLSHLPVVDEGMYCGLLSDEQIYNWDILDKPVKSVLHLLEKTHTHNSQSIFEVAALMNKMNLTILPIINKSNMYEGAIVFTDLIKQLAQYFSLDEIGGIIVLEMNVNEYSIMQISQIVETNDTKILGLLINKDTVSNKMEVILKLDKEDLTSVLETFKRYNYQIKSVHQDVSAISDLYEERYDQFMKYLDL